MFRYLYLLFLFPLVACSAAPSFIGGERRDIDGAVQLAPELAQVEAPLEPKHLHELKTLTADGKALQYYAEASDKDIAFLTFDDMGSGRNFSRILRVLDKYGAKATFFVNCRILDPNHPDYDVTYLGRMRRLQRDGHTIANHSYSHFSQGSYWYNYYRDHPVFRDDGSLSPPPNSSAQGYTYHYGFKQGLTHLRNEIDACDVIMNTHGLHAYDPIFRPPFGEYMPVLATALAQAGYSASYVLNWDISTCDYVTSTTAGQIKRALVDGIVPRACADNSYMTTRPLRHGDIVLLHWSKNNSVKTAAGLDLALASLSDSFDFVALQNESRSF